MSANPWTRLMVVAFLSNGIGPFGLKILAEAGLAEAHQFRYLAYWYLGGLILTTIAFLTRPRRVRGVEIGLGALMGAASLAGQSFTSLALAHQAPGHIVFPLTTGGTLLIVATAGILLFREPVSVYGVAGIVLGIVGLMILSLA